MGAYADLRSTPAYKASKTLRVLILDDDPVDAGLLADICSAVDEYDVRCRIAADLDQARAAVEATEFDLVFADYWLGGTTSIAFLAELAGTCPNLPVVMISGAESLDVQTVCLRAGALAFLPKADVSRTSVRAQIHTAVSGHGHPRRDAEPKSDGDDAQVVDQLARKAERVALTATMLRHGSHHVSDRIDEIRTLSNGIRADAREISRRLKSA